MEQGIFKETLIVDPINLEMITKLEAKFTHRLVKQDDTVILNKNK